ncbi:MAG TPA: cyclopropane-fatty-acyl-phospholipid synthase family protein [Burkholderiales bacterium]|nr:cyclopropane-fatty-acyl-phospholipid synthase family protein [Burkholderiales bacterium]
MSARSQTASDLRSRVPLAARAALALLDRIDHGRIEVALPDGSLRALGGGAPVARLEIADWGVFGAALRRGDIGFAEAFVDGRWSSPDVAQLLTVIARNRDALERAVYGGFWGRLAYRLRHARNANTRRGSRRNIAAHYDLGNDFYALWLDPSMTYSSALFADNSLQPLEAAQAAKCRRILERLAPRLGDHILEIGCGWGALAEMAARDFGCRVTGLTLSEEQLAYADARMHRAGVADRVDIAYRDYRDERGSYEHVVSVEMYEAVGERYWPTYFRAIGERLKPGGRAVVQAITIADRLFDRYRTGTDFIQQYVFPGGMLASPTRFRAEVARAGLHLEGELGFGADYAETLRRWRWAFKTRLPEMRALGYDERFLRTWEFYLAYCEAGFASGCTDVHQFEIARPR